MAQTTLDTGQQKCEPGAAPQSAPLPEVQSKAVEPEQLALQKAPVAPTTAPPPLTSPWSQIVKSPAKIATSQPLQSVPSKPAQQTRRPPAVIRSHASNAALPNGRASGPHHHGPRPNPHFHQSGSALHESEGRGINGDWQHAKSSSRTAASGAAHTSASAKQQQQQQQSQQQPQPQQASADHASAQPQHQERHQHTLTPAQEPTLQHQQQQEQAFEDTSSAKEAPQSTVSAAQQTPASLQVPDKQQAAKTNEEAEPQEKGNANPAGSQTSEAEQVAASQPGPVSSDEVKAATASSSSADSASAAAAAPTPASAPVLPPKPAWKVPTQGSLAQSSPMGGGQAWPSLRDTRDPQKKTRSLPASPVRPEALRSEEKEGRTLVALPAAAADEVLATPPPPPAMSLPNANAPTSSHLDSHMLDTSQASATGHSLAISIPSMPPPADSAASSPASITTTLSAPAGSGTSRNSAGFRAAGGKFSGNQRNTISSGRWSRNTNGPRGGTLPNSPVGPSARGLASSNGFGPGGPGLPVTGRGPGKASGRGRGRGGSQRQDPQAAASPFNAEAWQQSQAAAAAAFYQTQMAYATAGYGMGAAPTQLAQAVRHQIEYYLSLENLVRDLFLRAKMDSDGWIPLSIIAGFNRVRVMTSDVALIATSLLRSPVAELSPDALMVRPRDNPWQWVLPAEQRDQAAAALVAHMRSQRQQQQLQMRVPQGHEARPRNATLANGRSSQEGKPARSTAVQPVMAAPSGELSDEDVGRLFLVASPLLADPTRQPSEGRASWDVAGVLTQVQELLEPSTQSSDEGASSTVEAVGGYYARQGGSKNGLSGGTGRGQAFGWLLAPRPAASPANGVDEASTSASSTEQPSAADMSGRPISYSSLRARCTGTSPGLSGKHMAGLFHFWSCLLQDHFNAGMFKDFQAAAWRQSEQSHTEGLNSLFAFYSYGLEKTFRPSVYQAFEQDALKDKAAGRLGGLEKLWGFHHHHGLPATSDVSINSEVQELLSGPYSSLESFRSVPSGKDGKSKTFAGQASKTPSADMPAEQESELPKSE